MNKQDTMKKKFELHPSIKKVRSNSPFTTSYQYATRKGKISLLHPCIYTMDMYEIYCVDGELFDSVERFTTEEGVLRRIEELLIDELKLEQGAYYWAQLFADDKWELYRCTCDVDNLLMYEYTRAEFTKNRFHRIHPTPVKQPKS